MARIGADGADRHERHIMTEETHGAWSTRDERISAEREAAARAELTASTQKEYPWRAAIRTGAQVAVSLIAVLLVAIPLLIDTMGVYLPDGWVAWLLAASGVLTALSTFLARLMAAEPVLDFVARYLPFLSPKEK